jgi:cold-inducible RNA-binding protein
VLNIFVRNLDRQTTQAELRDLFGAYGTVKSVTIVSDRDTGEPRGFAFIEMTDPAEAQAAITSLNGFRLNNRALRLNEARPKEAQEFLRDSGRREHRHHRI